MMCASKKKTKKFWQFWKYCEQKLSLALFHNYEHGLTINCAGKAFDVLRKIIILNPIKLSSSYILARRN